VAALYAALFDAYNRCDLEKFSSFFVNDVEFSPERHSGEWRSQGKGSSFLCGSTRVTRGVSTKPGTFQVRSPGTRLLAEVRIREAQSALDSEFASL